MNHCKELLEELTQNLQSANLWQTMQPSEVALNSSAPFCCDTLTFAQWLQFIFIPRISKMIALEQELPTNIALLPMAEESFKLLSVNITALLGTIGSIDKLLSGNDDLTSE